MMPREETALSIGCFLRLPIHIIQAFLPMPKKTQYNGSAKRIHFNFKISIVKKGLRRMKPNRQPDRSSQVRSPNRQAVFCPKTGKSVTPFFFEKVS
jgi:hypothetical protein